jgi:PKHD-type hydroxylase
MDKYSFLEKNENITDFYFFKSVFDTAEIDRILEISEKYNSKIGYLSGGKINYDIRNSKIKWIPHNDETEFIYKKLFDLIKISNKSMWNFNLTNFKEQLQLSEYSSEVEGHYTWHMDCGKEVNTRKLSVSIQISDPEEYEGGELNIHTHAGISIAPKLKGTVIIFPSYLLHQVTKVTKGNRKSLVCWIHGPPFV